MITRLRIIGEIACFNPDPNAREVISMCWGSGSWLGCRKPAGDPGRARLGFGKLLAHSPARQSLKQPGSVVPCPRPGLTGRLG